MRRRAYFRYGLLGLLCLLGIMATGCSSDVSFDSTEDIKISLTTNPNPPRTGDGQLIVQLARSDGQPITDVNVSVSISASGMKSGTQDGMAVNQGDGRYSYLTSFHMRTKFAVRLWIYRAGKLISVQDSTISM